MTELQDRTNPEWATCACGHSILVHQLIVNKHGTHRGPCSTQDATGKCGCRFPR